MFDIIGSYLEFGRDEMLNRDLYLEHYPNVISKFGEEFSFIMDKKKRF